MDQTVSSLPEWKAMVDFFYDCEYGTEILYSDLNSKLIDGDIRTNKRYVFEKFKKIMLREYNKALENVHKKGYRIVNPNEHTRLTNREVKRAERRARSAVDIILHTPMELLDDKERAIATLTASRVQTMLASIVADNSALKENTKFQLPLMPRR